MWIRASIDTGEIVVIVGLTYLIGVAGSFDYVASSYGARFLIVTGGTGYLLPVLLGNFICGVSVTGALNHAQVVAEGG